MSPGILGGDASTCPLPRSEGQHFQQTVWCDTRSGTSLLPSALHQGVQLEVLDFGGQGIAHPFARRASAPPRTATTSSRRGSRSSIA